MTGRIKRRKACATATVSTPSPKNYLLNMLKKWMRHAKLEKIKMYLNAIVDEQKIIVAQMWE